MKILITGGSGFLGEFLNKEFSMGHNILTLYHTKLNSCSNYKSYKSDITNREDIKNIFSEFNPDVVLHAAAIADPIECNKLERKTVYNVNVNSTQYLAELCDFNKSLLIYISTDLVYAGYRGSMLDEESKLVPISFYAETKLMAEVKIKEIFDNYVILRQALLFGLSKYNSNNHFQFMFKSFNKGNVVKVFTDQFRTPISVFESARAINKLIKKNVKNKIINLGGKERVSRAKLVELLCDVAGFDKSLLKKIRMSEIPDYTGVADVSLNTEKLSSFGIKIKSLEDSIREIIQYFQTSKN